jgi:2-polyprenyl-3-methyl-5-hydroxy-6-metoxy-1,4-benzoquinol methylase
MKNKPGHWTEELFEKHPELFVGALTERMSMTSDEVDTLLSHLKKQGYKPKRILDLNCGIGRHAVELGKRNIQVVGTDISSYYLAIARRKAKQSKVDNKVTFQHADMRKVASRLSTEKKFDGIVCLWTSFGFYNDETNSEILRSCLSLVRPGGFFALDIINRDWLLSHYEAYRFSRSHDYLVLQEGKFNPQNSRNYSTWTFLKQSDEKTYILEDTVTLDHRIWSLHELIHLFKSTGWKFKAAYPGISSVGFTPIQKSPILQENDVLKAALLLIIAYRPDNAPPICHIVEHI